MGWFFPDVSRLSLETEERTRAGATLLDFHHRGNVGRKMYAGVIAPRKPKSTATSAELGPRNAQSFVRDMIGLFQSDARAIDCESRSVALLRPENSISANCVLVRQDDRGDSTGLGDLITPSNLLVQSAGLALIPSDHC